MIKRALVSGVVSAGARVRDVGELPVPVSQFSARVGNCDAAIHVLVSPLDQRSVDIRFFDGEGLPLDKRSQRRFENLFFREDFRRAAFYEMGEIEHGEPIEHYRERLLSAVDAQAIRESNLRIVIDYDYSMASIVLPEVLNQLEAFVIPLNTGIREGAARRDIPQEMSAISTTVNADFGVVLGHGGESLKLIDDTGAAVDPYQLLAILAIAQVRRTPGAVVIPAVAPEWLSSVITDAGGSVVWCKADSASILHAAAQPGVVFAGDGNGQYVWPEHLVAFDSMCAVVKLVEWEAVSDRPLSAAREALPRTAYLAAEQFVPWEYKGRVMRLLIEENRSDDVDLVDGLKINVDGGFVLVRPDPDLPAYQVVASVSDDSQARELVDVYLGKVKAAAHRSGYRPEAVFP
jgi:mannose-1-phosphate guanylyltransferase/phosphomannomutase